MFATVELANGFKFPGSACRDKGEALESAASVALFQLVRTSRIKDRSAARKRHSYNYNKNVRWLKSSASEHFYHNSNNVITVGEVSELF